MSYIFLLLSFLLTAQTPVSTDPEPSMTISATGKVEVPANQIQFRINMNAVAESPQQAYALHQKREEALVDLLKKYEVTEKDISYEPISISKIRHYDRENADKVEYQTQQTVALTLHDFEIYEKIQVGLISHGFDNFSGHFTNTEIEKAKNEALRRAINEAREKATLIARETGVSLGPVTRIDYSFDDVQPYLREEMQMKAVASDSGLMEYKQSVSVSARITIHYAIQTDD